MQKLLLVLAITVTLFSCSKKTSDQPTPSYTQKTTTSNPYANTMQLGYTYFYPKSLASDTVVPKKGVDTTYIYVGLDTLDSYYAHDKQDPSNTFIDNYLGISFHLAIDSLFQGDTLPSCGFSFNNTKEKNTTGVDTTGKDSTATTPLYLMVGQTQGAQVPYMTISYSYWLISGQYSDLKFQFVLTGQKLVKTNTDGTRYFIQSWKATKGIENSSQNVYDIRFRTLVKYPKAL